MKKIIIVLFLIPLILFITGSCKKEVVGPKGDKGISGGTGNLKQTHRTFVLSTNSWVSSLGVWRARVYAPEVTDDVIKKGEVRLFMKVNDAWWSLPYGIGNIFMEQESELGYLNIKYSHIHGDPPPAPANTEFKLVTYSPI